MPKAQLKGGRHVTLTEVAEILGVGRTTVGGWIKRGCPYIQRADRNTRTPWMFDLSAVIAWKEQQAVLAAVGESADAEIAGVRLRKMAAEAALAELTLSKQRGDAVSIGHIEQVWTDIVSTFRSKMLVLPQRIAPVIAGENSEKAIIKALQMHIFEALEELSRFAVDVTDFLDDD